MCKYTDLLHWPKTNSIVLRSCHKCEKSQPIHDSVLCVNTIGALDHTYTELSVARATIVLLTSQQKSIQAWAELGQAQLELGLEVGI